MEKIRLGKTELMVSKVAFGALPLQRVPMEEAVLLLRAAYEGGINFFDTARGYTDSEEKIGAAFSAIRHNIILATKTKDSTRELVLKDIETSLKRLKTDYIDIMQLHNPAEMTDFDDPDGSYAGLVEAKKRGWIRHIGISNHRIHLAHQFIESGVFETMQYPFSPLATDQDIALMEHCKAQDMGFIAMKSLSGGLLADASLVYGFMERFDHVVPIYGIQRLSELEEFLTLEGKPTSYTQEELEKAILKEKAELGGHFCRGCGYCMPCPQGIPIDDAARMKHFLLRSPYHRFLGQEWQEKMLLIETCTNCGSCKSKCPYQLDCPTLLKNSLAFYRQFLKEHT